MCRLRILARAGSFVSSWVAFLQERSAKCVSGSDQSIARSDLRRLAVMGGMSLTTDRAVAGIRPSVTVRPYSDEGRE